MQVAYSGSFIGYGFDTLQENEAWEIVLNFPKLTRFLAKLWNLSRVHKFLLSKNKREVFVIMRTRHAIQFSVVLNVFVNEQFQAAIL